jgi:omega-amidase
MGAKLIICPSAFSLKTGSLHFESILKSRAIECCVYLVASCTARHTEDTSVYQAWGHSTCIDPFGNVLAKASEKQEIIYAEIDIDKCLEI